MNIDEIESLKMKALAASRGPWEIRTESNPPHFVMSSRNDDLFIGAPICETRSPLGCPGADSRTESSRVANAQHIAAANPATVLALIEQLEKVTADRNRFAANFKSMCDIWSDVDTYARTHVGKKIGKSVAEFALKLLKEGDAAIEVLIATHPDNNPENKA